MNVDELKSLRERVLAAHGPDRALDIAISRALGIEANWHGELDLLGYPIGGFCALGMRPLSASIDAALALVERMLPRWRVALDIKGKPEAPVAWVDDGAGGPSMPSIANTPPLAILAALLSALIAQEEAKEAGR